MIISGPVVNSADGRSVPGPRIAGSCRDGAAVHRIVTYLDDLVEELRLRGLDVLGFTITNGGPVTASLALGAGAGRTLISGQTPLILEWRQSRGWELRRGADPGEPAAQRCWLTDEWQPSPAILACLLLDAARP